MQGTPNLCDDSRAVQELASIGLRKTVDKCAAEPGQVGFALAILLGKDPQRLAHDLALVVVETRADFAVDELLELAGEVDDHEKSLLLAAGVCASQPALR